MYKNIILCKTNKVQGVSGGQEHTHLCRASLTIIPESLCTDRDVSGELWFIYGLLPCKTTMQSCQSLWIKKDILY